MFEIKLAHGLKKLKSRNVSAAGDFLEDLQRALRLSIAPEMCVPS